MTALHLVSLKAFSEAIERIHRGTELGRFLEVVFEAIELLIPDVLISQGKRDAEIAAILGGSVRTIHKHVQRLLKKLHVETRTAAAVRAMELGIDGRPLS